MGCESGSLAVWQGLLLLFRTYFHYYHSTTVQPVHVYMYDRKWLPSLIFRLVVPAMYCYLIHPSLLLLTWKITLPVRIIVHTIGRDVGNTFGEVTMYIPTYLYLMSICPSIHSSPDDRSKNIRRTRRGSGHMDGAPMLETNAGDEEAR